MVALQRDGWLHFGHETRSTTEPTQTWAGRIDLDHVTGRSTRGRR